MGRTKAILEGIIARGFHRRVTFSAQTRVDRIDEEFIRLLKTANFETLELGVETGNPEVLRSIKKGITLEQVEHAVALAKANGLRVWCKFILGHPNETHETIRDTIDFIAKINPHQLSVSIMTPFPGTPIHEMALRGEGGYRLPRRRLGGLRQVLERRARARDGQPRPAQALPDRVLREPLRPQSPLPRARRGWSSRTARSAGRCCSSAVGRTALESLRRVGARRAQRVPSAFSQTGDTPARR